MYKDMYVYMYIYIHTHIYIYMYMDIYTHKQMHKPFCRGSENICTFTRAHMHTHSCMHENPRTGSHTQKHILAHTKRNINVKESAHDVAPCVHIYIYIYTSIHKHTHTYLKVSRRCSIRGVCAWVTFSLFQSL
jgi:hypothetical protein